MISLACSPFISTASTFTQQGEHCSSSSCVERNHCVRSLFRLFNCQVRLLIILFRLFCGKKQNPLRNNRIDSHLCDIDQLFIVTLSFTILLFLLPSIFMYYAVFTSVREGKRPRLQDSSHVCISLDLDRDDIYLESDSICQSISVAHTCLRIVPMVDWLSHHPWYVTEH